MSKIITACILVFSFLCNADVYARVPNPIEQKLLLLNEEIEAQLAKKGLSIEKIHSSKLSRKYTDQKYVRDCWVKDESGKVVLKLFFFLERYWHDLFIKSHTIQLTKTIKIRNKQYFLGIVSEDQQLIKTVSDVVYELDTQNVKYDEYPF
jgi:hypothetical protein